MPSIDLPATKPKREAKTNFILHVRNYENGTAGVWLVTKEGAIRQGVMSGIVRRDKAEKLQRLLEGLVTVETDEAPYSVELPGDTNG